MISNLQINGQLAQLVSALPSHGRGHRFESCIAHNGYNSKKYKNILTFRRTR